MYMKNVTSGEYQVRCLTNGKLMYLQGSLSSNHYVFKGSVDYEIDDDAKFYCEYYDEVDSYNRQYFQANNRDEEIKANIDFFKFKDEAQRPSYKNYNLEKITSSATQEYFWSTLSESILSTLVYFVFLQGLKITYQYVVFGAFTWHPLKNVKKKKKK